VNVSEQLALVRLREPRPRYELDRAAEVVENRGGEQEVRAQTLVELCGLAADRGHANGVLEQAARIPVMAVGCRGQRSQQPPDLLVVDEASDRIA